MRRAVRRIAGLLALVLALVLGLIGAHAPAATVTATAATTVAATATDCPPQAAAPSPAQQRDGLREARDRGLLWRLDKDGLTGWLYGTLHVGRLAWAYPGPRISETLRAADTVALPLLMARRGWRVERITWPAP